MITVLCSECKDPLELAGRSVTIPYVCDECKEAAELRDAMAPAIKSYDEFPNLIDVPEPSHEATIENTTLLIEDLEEQVRRGLDQIKQDTELLSDMDKRNTELAIHNSDLHRLNERLQMDMSELISRLYKLRDQLFARIFNVEPRES